jgi:nucleotide-binding universal stress UspA family protein
MKMRLRTVDDEGTRDRTWIPRRILVAFDGSDDAWAALGRAIEIAVRERALLTIAAVVTEPSPWIGMGLVSLPYSREVLRRDAQRAMEQALAAARDEVPATVSVTTRLLFGRPRRALGRLVARGDYDLVLARRRPRSWRGRWVPWDRCVSPRSTRFATGYPSSASSPAS